MTIFMILKVILILVYLIMFVRRPSLSWGIGLLAVTVAVLFDALLFTFDEEALRSEMGFFYFFITGTLFAGATLWLWGLFIPRLIPETLIVDRESSTTENVDFLADVTGPETSRTVVDNQMLFDEIQNRFGREDVLDLMFDLEFNEADVMPIDQELNHLIVNIMNKAGKEGKSGALALAVERILTPPPEEHLPRIEKIEASSPPTILRHYLLMNFSLEELKAMSKELEIDWEQLAPGTKREKSRSMLQYLYRRNRVDELIKLMKRTRSQKETA